MLLMRPIAPLLCALSLSAQAPARTQDLAWMAGHWRGESEGVFLEEIWTAPEQGQMQGVARELKDGKARSLELCLLKKGPAGLELRMRHFDGDLKPKESGEALRWSVKEGGKDSVLFEEAGGVRLRYLRKGERLEATLEKGGRSFAFAYTLVR